MSTSTGGARKRGLDSLSSTERSRFLDELLADAQHDRILQIRDEAAAVGERISYGTALDRLYERMNELGPKAVETLFPQFSRALDRVSAVDKSEDERNAEIAERQHRKRYGRTG